MSTPEAAKKFEGKWKERKNENMEEVMKEMKMGFMVRKMVGKVHPEMELKFEGTTMTMSMKVPLKTTTVVLKLDESVKVDSDFDKAMMYLYMDGDELVTENTPLEEGKNKMKMRRRIEDGELVIITTVREYKRPFDSETVLCEGKRWFTKCN